MVRYEKIISTFLVCNFPRRSICHFIPFNHQREKFRQKRTICHFIPFKHQQEKFCQNMTCEANFRSSEDNITRANHTFDHYGPSLFFKPRHEVKISMKRFFPRECNQKFRRSGPRRILNSSRRPAVQWRSRTAMKIILERSHVNKVSMKRKEERKYEKDEGKPSIYRKFGVSLTLRLADESN